MADTVRIGDYDYTTISETEASAVAYNKNKSSYGAIQSSVEINGNTYTVTSLERCFDSCRSFTTSPTIPSTIKNMDFCFYSCWALTTAPSIPNGVVSMRSCFGNNEALTNINTTIPGTVKNMHQCFSDCMALVNASVLVLSEGIEDMSECFAHCNKLTSAPSIPNSVLDMEYCFNYCEKLTSAPVIPPNVTNLLDCFYGCHALTSVPDLSNLAGSNINMDSCFLDCTSLVNAPVLPEGVTNLSGCFFNCTKLKTAPIIPDGVVDLGGCFYQCYALTDVGEIPDSVTDMSSCFKSCTALVNAPAIPKNVTDLNGCFGGCTSLTGSVVVGSTPGSEWGSSAIFTGTTKDIQVVVIGSSNIPAWETIVGGYSNVSLYDYDTAFDLYFEYGDYAYRIESATEASAFALDRTKSSYEPAADSVGGIPLTSMRECYGETPIVASPAIPDTVTDLYFCFANCAQLVAPPVLPSSATDLTNCFYYCESLTTPPQIPSGVTNMSWCFASSGITTAPVLPSWVVNLEYCFSQSNIAAPPVIPSSVTSMKSCFSGCFELTSAPVIPSGVLYTDRCFADCNITDPPVLPAGLITMTGCFSGCQNLETAPVIPSRIDDMEECFLGCWALTAPPVIPEGVTNLKNCFRSCSSITTAPDIPSSVTNMDYCFESCRSLEGKIVVSNNPTNVTRLFYGTHQDIYIVRSSTSVPSTAWSRVGASWSNVHFELDDNQPPNGNIIAYIRVDQAGSKTPSVTGDWMYIQFSANHYKTSIPPGWSIVPASIVVKDQYGSGGQLYPSNNYYAVMRSEGASASDGSMTAVGQNGQYIIDFWINLKTSDRHVLDINIANVGFDSLTPSISTADDILNANAIQPYYLTLVIPRNVPLVSYFHGGSGLAIGKYADTAETFDIDMDTRHKGGFVMNLSTNLQLDADLLQLAYALGLAQSPSTEVNLKDFLMLTKRITTSSSSPSSSDGSDGDIWFVYES